MIESSAVSENRISASSFSDLAWRITGLVNLYRVVVTAGLFILARLPATASTLSLQHPGAMLWICLLHFCAGCLLVVVRRDRWAHPQWLALIHVGIDAVGFGAIVWAAGGVSSGLGILMLLPVGAMSLLANNRRSSYLMASFATLALLFQQAATQIANNAGMADSLAVGLLGIMLFAVAMGLRPLASRLRDSEARVLRQAMDLENQAQLSQYILQNLRESLLVVDAGDRIRLINDSAADLLGAGDTVRGALLGEISPRLLYLLSKWRQSAGLQSAASETFLAADGTRIVQPHFVQLGPGHEDVVLVFLEDTSFIAQKVQQSKLAALGRLSASIAHEIRNPVGAMSHAAQLLAESSSLPAADRRLTEIITGNATRVSRLIGNMLEFSRRGTGTPESVVLSDWLARFREEFLATLQLPTDRLSISAAESPGAAEGVVVRVDPTQLHQIVWNLCQNALTHGGASRGSYPVELHYGRHPGSGRPYLEVSDRGPGVPAELRERAFEPFYTTSGQGTGLGLFLARELAQGNDAALVCDDRPGGGSVFRLVFSDPSRWST
ncbi:MAG: hypothetical protein RLZZ200_695 [Pseudomonadota bacterium]|jgi:two-component system sensor histidine kinase PilS (NtrC family)